METIEIQVRRLGCDTFETISITKYKKDFNLEDVEEIIIPDGITKIWDCFKGCKNLKKVSLPDTLIEIEKETFKNCKKLEEIIIPNSVKQIGTYAFHHCTRLKKVVITNENLLFSDSSFTDTSTLLTNKYGSYEYIGTPENPYLWMIKSHSYSSGEIHKDCKHILCSFYSDADVIEIPDNVETLAPFFKCKAKKIIIGRGVKYFLYSSIVDCEDLKELTVYSKTLKFEGNLSGVYGLKLNITKECYEINKDYFEQKRIKELNFID